MTLYGDCPRCSGSLHEESDYHGHFLTCINCGYLQPLDGFDPEGKREIRYGAVGRKRMGKLKGMTRLQRSPGRAAGKKGR